MIRYAVLGSGSSGNAYVFSDGADSIIVDNGFSRAELIRRCDAAGTDWDTVRAVFVTHMHPDHCRGVGTLARKDGFPVFISAVAGKLCTPELARMAVPEGQLNTIDEGEERPVGGFSVRCFYTSHDSSGSVGYRICHKQGCFCIVTDTGCFDERMVGAALESDVLFLESNYEPRMLKSGPYPPPLKKRIDGRFGHLSNEQAMDFLVRCGFYRDPGTDIQGQLCYNQPDCRVRRVYLVHLSSTNNNVELLRSRYSSLGDRLYVCPKGEMACGVLGGQ